MRAFSRYLGVESLDVVSVPGKNVDWSQAICLGVSQGRRRARLPVISREDQVFSLADERIV